MTMTADTWRMVSYVGFALAAVFLLAAIILFIKFRIWALFGELSGRTAARQMEEIRKGNREVVGRWHKMGASSDEKSDDSMRKVQIKRETGRLSEEDPFGKPDVGQRTGRTEPLRGDSPDRRGSGTDILGENPAAQGGTVPLGGNPAVQNGKVTELLANSGMEQGGSGNTMVLAQPMDAGGNESAQDAENAFGTAAARGRTEPLEQSEFSPIVGTFSVKKNVVVVHTDEMPGA